MSHTAILLIWDGVRGSFVLDLGWGGSNTDTTYLLTYKTQSPGTGGTVLNTDWRGLYIYIHTYR